MVHLCDRPKTIFMMKARIVMTRHRICFHFIHLSSRQLQIFVGMKGTHMQHSMCIVIRVAYCASSSPL